MLELKAKLYTDEVPTWTIINSLISIDKTGTYQLKVVCLLKEARVLIRSTK
jgi:hypothetical protein